MDLTELRDAVADESPWDVDVLVEVCDSSVPSLTVVSSVERA